MRLMSSKLQGSLVVDPYLEINGTSKAENRNALSSASLSSIFSSHATTPFTGVPRDRGKGLHVHCSFTCLNQPYIRTNLGAISANLFTKPT